jgi:hypothetical protein
MTGQELMALAERVAEQWKDDPNVVGVGFGLKERAGQPVPGPSLCFTVRRKLATPEEIQAAGSRPIPSQIEGVQTDLNVVHGAPAAMPTGSRGTHIEEPLKGGVSTSVLGSFLSFPTGYGTLGSVCFRDDGKLMALSNAHVWGSDLGSDIVQPFLPTGEFLEAGVKLLTCGPVISFLAEGKLPRGLTAVLTGAAAAVWAAAVASDVKDPQRRGQEATLPAEPGERTSTESVRFDAEPKGLPLPGTPYHAAVLWEYSRQTNRAAYPFAVSETRVNEHVLVYNHIWTNRPNYPAGAVVDILAMLEASGVDRPDAFHVVAHLASSKQPERRISRVLQPATCGRVPFLCVNFADQKPDLPSQFPFQRQGVTFRASRPGTFRDWWPVGAPDGQIELQFPEDGLEIDVLPSSRAEAHVVQFNPKPIVLEAFDQNGVRVDEATTSGDKRVENVLIVRGPAIRHLVLRGGQNQGLLLLVCLTLLKSVTAQPTSERDRIFCYRGQYTLDPTEPPSSWSALLSAQTVNIVAPGMPPALAAATIGGLEGAALAVESAGCLIVLALDKLFDVI